MQDPEPHNPPEATTPHPPGVDPAELPPSESDAEFKRTMAIAEDFMKRHHNALRELAKGPDDYRQS